MGNQWLVWAQRLQAIAQTGLTFAENAFDIQRYQQIRDIAAEMMAGTDSGEIDMLRRIFDQQAGYATPKVDVRGVVFDSAQRVLLVREKLDEGRWTLPGGWADVGESASLAVEREVQEEAGYTVRATKLLALYDRLKHDHPPYLFHAYKVFFQCTLLDTTQRLVANVETDEAAWFAADAIDTLDLSVGRVTARQLHRFFAHLAHPEWQTDFD